MDTGDLWSKLEIRMAEAIGQIVEARFRSVADKYFRSEVKVIFSEKEAAAFLCVSVGSLAAWRKRGLVTYARYPVGRIRDGEDDKLSDIVSYSLADLLNFRETYLVRSSAPNKFEIKPVLTLLGPELKEVGRRAA